MSLGIRIWNCRAVCGSLCATSIVFPFVCTEVFLDSFLPPAKKAGLFIVKPLSKPLSTCVAQAWIGCDRAEECQSSCKTPSRASTLERLFVSVCSQMPQDASASLPFRFLNRRDIFPERTQRFAIGPRGAALPHVPKCWGGRMATHIHILVALRRAGP